MDFELFRLQYHPRPVSEKFVRRYTIEAIHQNYDDKNQIKMIFKFEP